MVRRTLKILQQNARSLKCLTILGHYALKGLENPPLCHTEAFCNEKSKEAFADIA